MIREQIATRSSSVSANITKSKSYLLKLGDLLDFVLRFPIRLILLDPYISNIITS